MSQETIYIDNELIGEWDLMVPSEFYNECVVLTVGQLNKTYEIAGVYCDTYVLKINE